MQHNAKTKAMVSRINKELNNMWCCREANISDESKAILSSLKMLLVSRYSRRMRAVSINEGNHLATEESSILVINDNNAPKIWIIG